MEWERTKYPRIYVRHQKACPHGSGGRCRCERSWRVRYTEGGRGRWSHVFKSEAEARNWRQDGQGARTREAASTRTGKTFNELADEFKALALAGAVAQKNGRAYSPGTLDTYTRMYDNHARSDIGARAAEKLTVIDWQLWVDGLKRKGLKRNSISAAVNYVRVVYRWACSPTRRILAVNETRGLELPPYDETPRDRVASPDETRKLLAALTSYDRTAFGLSLLAGLRNVEREHLDWSHIDFETNKLHVRTTKGGEGGAGIRTLPIDVALSAILKVEHLRQGRPGSGLVCLGPRGGVPDPDSQRERAEKAWTDAGLEPIGFHECRHTFISTMIAAGGNAKSVSTLAGHASIQITYDRYGHLFPGHEDEMGVLLNAFRSRGAVESTNVSTNEPTALDKNQHPSGG